MADGERRRASDRFWGSILHNWQIIAASSAVAWGCTTYIFSIDKRVTVMENRMIEFISVFKESVVENKDYRIEVKSEVKAIREEIRDLARATRRQ